MRQLSYRITGEGPPLVLLHPVGLDGNSWEGLPEIFGISYTVVAADLTGHGSSPPAPRPGRMGEYVDDVIRLLQQLDRGPATLLGVSFGGMIAQHVATTNSALVRRLVLAGCPGHVPSDARSSILQRGQAAEAGGMSAVLQGTLERWFTPSFRSTDQVRRVADRLLSNAPSNFAAAWEAISEHDARPGLGTLRCPTLVVGGGRDLATSLEAKRALAAAIPQSELVVLPDAPHMMQIECSASFAEVVQRFLSDGASS
jgi:3-oxoadipate enol-lactonase